MRIITSIFFLTCIAGSAWAVPGVPAPEVDIGILGMAAAAGTIYLVKRFKRS
jgi:hydrogenase/urease accessory protein HupE